MLIFSGAYQKVSNLRPLNPRKLRFDYPDFWPFQIVCFGTVRTISCKH